MAVACMFSIHIFAVAFHRMLVEAKLLPFKLLYPRGYKILLRYPLGYRNLTMEMEKKVYRSAPLILLHAKYLSIVDRGVD